MAESALAVTRIAGALGAEVRGIDVKTIDADGARQVERLLWEHQVLFFPDQCVGKTSPGFAMSDSAQFVKLS